MSDVVIKVENLGKKYRIRHEQREPYTALRDVLANKVASFSSSVLAKGRHLFRPNGTASAHGADPLTPDLRPPMSDLCSPTSAQPPSSEDFWALKNVSFDVKRGEVVGIIGRNGAGKSTLLKILSRITEPTEGRVRIKGRVASLLEVGTGFHPELTGRENVLLNGAILGMSHEEIKRNFDEIVAFAEVEKFMDTPVKHYSSGMYVRLAFAVAAHLQPEILVVDEVLAVGDTGFQKKCLGKMGDVARSGRTVLLVSHNLSSLRTLCSQGILLWEGHVRASGKISEALSAYAADETVLNTKVYPEPSLVRRVAVTQHLDSIVLELQYSDIRGKLTLPGLSFVIHDVDGRPIFGHNPMLEQRDLQTCWPNEGVVRAKITSPKLLDGTYTVSVFLGDHYTTIFRDVNCLMFSVSGLVDANYQLPPHQVGPVFPVCQYEFLSAKDSNVAEP